MDLNELRQQTGEALKGEKKSQRIDEVNKAMALVETLEKDRAAMVGKHQAAQQAAEQWRGEAEAAESNLNRAVKALQALIGEAV